MNAKWLMLLALLFAVSCGRPGPTPEEERYMAQEGSLNHERLEENIQWQESINAFALNPSVRGDATWRQQALLNLSRMRSSEEALKQLIAPPKMRAVHDHLVKSCDFMLLAIKLYEEAVNGGSTAKFDEGADYQSRAVEENYAAASEVNRISELVQAGKW